MRTYDVVFNDAESGNNMGFKSTKEEAINYIQTWNGTGHGYFADYKGGVVEVIENSEEGEVVYSEEVI